MALNHSECARILLPVQKYVRLNVALFSKLDDFQTDHFLYDIQQSAGQ